MKKLLSHPIIYLLIASIFFLTQCKPDTTDAKDTLRIRIQDDPDCIHPIVSQSSLATQIEALIMPGLFEYDVSTLELKPILIKELTPAQLLNDSTLSYHYTFLDELRWDDGSKPTAKDIAFTIKAALNPYLKNKTWSGLFKNIVSVRAGDASSADFIIEVKKDFLLAREMSGNYNFYPAYFYDKENLMSQFTISDLQHKDSAQWTADEHVILKKFADQFQSPDFLIKNISGAGAYKLTSWIKGSKIILERKKDWWGDQLKNPNNMQQAFIKKIEYQLIPDDVAAITALKTGALDLANLLPKPFAELQKENNPNLAYATPSVMQYYYIELNTLRPGLNDKSVRQALAHAINQDEFIKSQLFGNATRVIGPIHPSKSYYNKSLVPYDYDLNKSIALLKNAGWKDSDADGILDKMVNGKKVKLAFKLLISGKDLGKNLGLHMQEECKKIGIDIEIINKEWALIQKDFATRDFDMATAVQRPSPSLYDPYQNWHSSNTTTPGTNRCGFATTETDNLIHIIRTSNDDGARTEAYLKFQEILYDNQPQIFFFTPTERIVYNKNLKITTGAKKPGYCENEIQKQ